MKALQPLNKIYIFLQNVAFTFVFTRHCFIKEPWATPNRATPKSCYPFKKKLKKSENNSKKKLKTIQQLKTTNKQNLRNHHKIFKYVFNFNLKSII